MAGNIKKVGYATYPSVKLQSMETDAKTGKTKFTFIKELLFGDFMSPYIEDGAYVTKTVTSGKKTDEYVKVHCRNADGWIKRSEMQFDRPLEVNFIDVGQGDGCHIVTPDDKHFLIDAGKSDNMYRFLKWRFNLRSPKNVAPPFTVVISHSDTDHYLGFGTIFAKSKEKEPQIQIKKVYHNGMIEGAGASLGTDIKYNGKTYVTDLCDTDADYQERIKHVKAGTYINMLKKTDAPKIGLRKGSEPLYDKNGLKMEVMGPVAEEIDGKAALPSFGDTGKTKNGHSVVVKLTIGHLRLLAGGDLNTESEYHLIKAYSGVDIAALKKELEGKKLSEADRKKKEAEIEKAVLAARESLEVDIAKSCHHGSADFSSEFLQVLNPIATIISSGDEEPHCHPRPDTLGTIGKYSRGKRSLIFSTELARSGKEFLELKDMDISAQKKKERVVTVYGMINVRTDGEKVVIAQKLESAAKGRNGDLHKLEWNEKLGQVEYISDKES